MAKLDWDKVETIVDEALNLPDKQRDDFIEEQCGENKALKSEVTLLLESIFDSDGWLENDEDYKKIFYKDISNDIRQVDSTYTMVGKTVGAYTVKEELGEGGMGSVYLAERSDGAFEHQVAIKIIRQSKANSDNIRRFEQERRILANLNHPGVAKLFDGGITEDGYPYFIMEYVDGVPVTDYCNKQNLSLEQRISIFKDILSVVSHAHESAIIHRDLKPDNIFITDTGAVKVLDFGISKILDDDSTEDFTQTKARLLTPRYAAPEQIKQQPVTTATDLYALGILFYQMLCGQHPFDLKELSQYEMEQTILNQAPVPPSDKLSDSFPVNKNQLQGDLDAIALKALRKEPTHRYRVANEFLKDIKNYEKGLPISARTDSFRYRSSKFIKRHKQGLIAAAGILLLIIGLSGFYAWSITQERNQAQFEAQRAEEVTGFLISILELNNPSQNSGDEVTINDALERGIQYLEEQEMSALNKATILGTIGSIQLNNGAINRAGLSFKKAMNYVTDSLSEQTTQTLLISTEFAEWNVTIGNMDEAGRYFELTDSLYQVNDLQNSISYLKHRLNYSDFLMEISQNKKALNLLSDLDILFHNFDKGDKSTTDLLADLYNNRGRAYKNRGKNEKALQNLEQALTLKKQIYDEENPKIAKLYHNMGVVYATMANYPKAMEMAQKAYEIRLKVFNPTHQLVGSTLHLLGNVAMALGNYEQAHTYTKKSVEITKKQHGSNHFRYALALREYAKALSAMESYDSALEKIEDASDIIKNNYGANHPYYGYMMNTYGDIYFRMGQYRLAMDYGDKSISNFTQTLGEQHPNLGQAYINQGKYALKSGKVTLADSLLTTSIRILEQHFDRKHPNIKKADSLLQLTSNMNSNRKSEL